MVPFFVFICFDTADADVVAGALIFFFAFSFFEKCHILWMCMASNYHRTQ